MSATPQRPPVERYVRVTLDHRGFTYEPAVEWCVGDDFNAIAAHLEDIVRDLDCRSSFDTMWVAETVGSVIRSRWPDRAYFVEVWQEGKRGFAQIFQPFGVPRCFVGSDVGACCGGIGGTQFHMRAPCVHYGGTEAG